MKKILLMALILSAFHGVQAQKRYYTKTGILSFEAGTPLEKIHPVNKSVTSVMDVVSGQIEFAVLIKGFEFEKALMQTHFNENYLESHKYPKSVFRGQITNLNSIRYTVDGSYAATVKGILEIHGVKKPVTVRGTIRVNRGAISASARFAVQISDYNISIPGIVRDKISKTAIITLNCSYIPLNPQ